MDQEFYFEESNPKKTKIIIVIMIIAFSLFCATLVYYRNLYTLHVKKDLVYEVGTQISEDVRDFVNNKVVDDGDYTLLLAGVSMEDNVLTKVGTYTFKVKYKNITKKGKLKVIDTVAPKVEVQDLTVGVNEEYEVSEFLTLCEDYSKPCNVLYEDESDKNLNKKEGSYKFNIIITDDVGNKVKKEVNLTVKKGYNLGKSKESDLTVHHIDPDLSDWDKSIVLKFSKGYDPNEIDESDAYSELLEITGSDLHNYIDPIYENNLITETQIIDVYNKYGLIIGYAIRVKLDNSLYLYLKNN